MVKRSLLYLFLGIGLFLFLSWYFSNIFLYVVISFVLATILRTPTNYISRTVFFTIRIPRFIAVLVSFLALISVFTLFVVTFIPLVSEQIKILKSIDYEEAFTKVSSPIESVEVFLLENNLTDQEPGFISDNLSSSIVDLIKSTDFSLLINSFIGYTGSFLVGVMAILFITFFLLYEQGIVRSNAISLIPNKYFEVSIAAVNKIEGLLSNYLLGLLFQMFAIFSIASIGLSLLGVKYAVTIALFAAVANLIPYAGPLLGAIFGIIVGVSTGVGLELPTDYFVVIIKIISVFVVASALIPFAGKEKSHGVKTIDCAY